jgi:hypothetical protein
MTSSEPPPPPVPAALRQRNQWLAIVAIVVAALVPIALAFNVDVCTPLRAVGIELAACARAVPAAPSPRAARDAGVP